MPTAAIANKSMKTIQDNNIKIYLITYVPIFLF